MIIRLNKTNTNDISEWINGNEEKKKEEDDLNEWVINNNNNKNNNNSFSVKENKSLSNQFNSEYQSNLINTW